jgi:hypothetical protein
MCRCGFLDDRAHTLLGKLIQPVERTEARFVLRYGETLVPAAIGIGEEIVARSHARVDGAQVEPESTDGRLRSLRRSARRGARRGNCAGRGPGGCGVGGHGLLLDLLGGACREGQERSYPQGSHGVEGLRFIGGAQ